MLYQHDLRHHPRDGTPGVPGSRRILHRFMRIKFSCSSRFRKGLRRIAVLRAGNGVDFWLSIIILFFVLDVALYSGSYSFGRVEKNYFGKIDVLLPFQGRGRFFLICPFCTLDHCPLILPQLICTRQLQASTPVVLLFSHRGRAATVFRANRSACLVRAPRGGTRFQIPHKRSSGPRTSSTRVTD